MQQTLAIIKPDAVSRQLVGEIIKVIEGSNFKIRAMRLIHLTKKEAECFYRVHADKAFFETLTDFMSSGPITVLALEAPDAIDRWRRMMGATDPAKADAQTLRREYGTSIERNATHGSDATETAAFELNFFFPSIELR